MNTITVGTADLRQALTAVRAHVSADKEATEYHRIRLTIGDENIAVTATDRFTGALAIVSTWETDAEPGLIVELLPDDVTKMLAIFKAGKEIGDEPQFVIRLEIDEQHVTVTDCSGMIDGRALRIPRLSTEDALTAVPVLINKSHNGQSALLIDMTINGDALARFKVAGNAYGAPVTIEARGDRRGLLIRCGESFLGLAMPRRLSEEDIVRAKEWAEGWDARLSDIVAAAEADE
ncbi:hypothetical protein [Nocardia brasiliensis]|uniref:hypothetical protein n=1 Tax=Nocardia brasiliensis TaxID=37326 RepID=UPI0024565633|nr:hypothetical protein [Nocardia brasiliensis]